MQENLYIFLPGGFKQFRILKSKFIISGMSVLVIGAGSEKIAEKIIDSGASSVKMIVNDFESLINSRLNLSKESEIVLEMMEYDNTDFSDNVYDLVYAQGSISSANRSKIIKEIKRILKADGVLCVGEMTSLRKEYPVFIKDIFESSEIVPLSNESCSTFYTQRNFSVILEQDLSSSLKSFYENAASSLEKSIEKFTDIEKNYYKKLLNKISHESNAYLKLGADKYIGFKMLILKLRGFAS